MGKQSLLLLQHYKLRFLFRTFGYRQFNNKYKNNKCFTQRLFGWLLHVLVSVKRQRGVPELFMMKALESTFNLCNSNLLKEPNRMSDITMLCKNTFNVFLFFAFFVSIFKELSKWLIIIKSLIAMKLHTFTCEINQKDVMRRQIQTTTFTVAWLW